MTLIYPIYSFESTKNKITSFLLNHKHTLLKNSRGYFNLFYSFLSQQKQLNDYCLPDVSVANTRQKRGTRVVFEIANNVRKKLADLFKEYTGEEFQFQKTRVNVKLFEEGKAYVSRSQAKRPLHALDAFEEIVLDFSGVETVGQGFADEIFRIYIRAHPNKKIIPIHCHENVTFMIERAKRSEML